jgi:hypothetical protein
VKWAGGGGGGLTNITETLHTASPNNTVNAEQLEVTGGTTNVDLVLTPKGTGAFILGNEPDGTATGGNKRGAGAVDLQMVRSSAARVASGQEASISGGANNIASNFQATVGGGGNNTASQAYATVCGGINNTASQQKATVAGGSSNVASGDSSTVLGGEGNTASAQFSLVSGNEAAGSIFGQYAHATGRFSAKGDAQCSRFIARNSTTSTTPVELFLNGTSLRLTIPSNKGIAGKMMVQAKQASSANQCYYEVDFVAVNNAGTSSLAFSNVTAHHESNAGADFAVTVDDALDAIIMTWTAPDSNTWRCVAVIEAVEVQ